MSDRQRAIAWLLGVILSTSGPACSSTQTVDPSAAPPAEHPCFNIRNVDSFSPLHPRYVYLRLITDRHYLLTLDHIYTSLPYATRIAISEAFTRVCSETGARLTFVDAGRRVSCRIVRVETVESREAAKKLVDERTTPKPRE
jgi:hypothetical protein